MEKDEETKQMGGTNVGNGGSQCGEGRKRERPKAKILTTLAMHAMLYVSTEGREGKSSHRSSGRVNKHLRYLPSFPSTLSLYRFPFFFYVTLFFF